jgi:hypothetical protein
MFGHLPLCLLWFVFYKTAHTRALPAAFALCSSESDTEKLSGMFEVTNSLSHLTLVYFLLMMMMMMMTTMMMIPVIPVITGVSDQNHFKIIQKIREHHTRKPWLGNYRKLPYWALHTYFRKC